MTGYGMLGEVLVQFFMFSDLFFSQIIFGYQWLSIW